MQDREEDENREGEGVLYVFQGKVGRSAYAKNGKKLRHIGK